jgi:hypothetical protein
LLRGLGHTEVRPAGRATCARHRAAPTGHPIAPTEFPKGRSAAGQSGPKTTVPGRMRPSGGGLPPPVSAERRILAATSPQRRRGAVARGQPSTDTRNVPAGQGPAGLQSPAASAARGPGDWACRRAPAEGLSSAAVDELTRVNMACRHLGAKRAGKKPGCVAPRQQKPPLWAAQVRCCRETGPEGPPEGDPKQAPEGGCGPGGGRYSGSPSPLYILGSSLSSSAAILTTSIGNGFFEVDFVWQSEET